MPTKKVRVTVNSSEEVRAWPLKGTLWKMRFGSYELWVPDKSSPSLRSICFETILGKRIFKAAKKAPQVIEVSIKLIKEA